MCIPAGVSTIGSIMKAFFKAVIQIKYTENEEKTDYKQLKQYLIENNLINEEFDFDQ